MAACLRDMEIILRYVHLIQSSTETPAFWRIVSLMPACDINSGLGHPWSFSVAEGVRKMKEAALGNCDDRGGSSQ